MRSLILVMSECSLNGRGQGHVSNFYIVDLENFATASCRYTGDIHNSTVDGLFMTPVGRAFPKRVFRTNCALRIKKCAPRITSGIYFLSTS